MDLIIMIVSQSNQEHRKCLIKKIVKDFKVFQMSLVKQVSRLIIITRGNHQHYKHKKN